MRTAVPYPSESPVVRSDHRRSRRPLIVFGPRGRVVGQRSGWTAEEMAVTHTAAGQQVPAWYLGPWIPLDDPTDDEQAREAFGALMSWIALAPTAGVAGVCVPRWAELPLVQERLRVATCHQLRAGLTAEGFADLRLAATASPMPLFHVGTVTSPRITRVPEARRLVTSEEHHLAWLEAALPTKELLGATFASAIGVGEVSPRTFAAATGLAERLRAAGWSRPQIGTYLEVFGYENSKGIVGVWPAKRLAEVAPVTR